MLQAAKGTGMGSQFCKTQRATSKQEPPPGHVIHPTGQLQGQNKAKAPSLSVNTGALPVPRPAAGMCHRRLLGVGPWNLNRGTPGFPALSYTVNVTGQFNQV